MCHMQFGVSTHLKREKNWCPCLNWKIKEVISSKSELFNLTDVFGSIKKDIGNKYFIIHFMLLFSYSAV